MRTNTCYCLVSSQPTTGNVSLWVLQQISSLVHFTIDHLKNSCLFCKAQLSCTVARIYLLVRWHLPICSIVSGYYAVKMKWLITVTLLQIGKTLSRRRGRLTNFPTNFIIMLFSGSSRGNPLFCSVPSIRPKMLSWKTGKVLTKLNTRK